MNDLEIARQLIAAGVPVFVARPDGNGGHYLPKQWQNTKADPAFLDAWAEGCGLGAVCGHVVDVVDVDPRNGGKTSDVGQLVGRAGVIAIAATPSDGVHYYVPTMNVRTAHGFMPGIDCQAGTVDGQGRGFVWIPPTVRKSKVTGEPAMYRWEVPPGDVTGGPGRDSAGLLAAVQSARANGNGTAPAALAAVVPYGQHHDALLSFAGTMLARGYPLEHAEVLIVAKLGHLDQPPGSPRAKYTPAEAVELVRGLYRTRPGLHPHDMVAATYAENAVNAESAEEEDLSAFTAFNAYAPVADPGMFAGILGEITEAVSPYTEASPVGIYGSLLAGTGALAGPGAHVQISATRHPLLVWALLLGRTGTGRKGEATNMAKLFLLQAEPATLPVILVGGLSSGEGLIERISDDDQPDDKRLLVVEAEFTATMARARREGSTLAQVLRLAWDGGPLYVINRKQLKASGSHIAIIGHVTPREFAMRMSDVDLAGGTYNRFLPLFVERAKVIALPDPVPVPVVSKLAGQLADAISKAGQAGQIRLTDRARQLWRDEIYPELTAPDDDDYSWSEFARRGAPYCLRVAGLAAALDGRNLISPDDLAAARALARYSIQSARFVLGNTHRDPKAERLLQSIAGAGPEGLTRNQIRDLFGRNLPAGEIRELLAKLERQGEIKSETKASGGRPVTVYARTGR